MAISTAIVAGNNADFDGDCLHVVPATSLHSQAELLYLVHPKYNMIVQKKLRVNFDHDEIQTLYSQFGLNSEEIHAALYDMANKEGSPKAYSLFCKIRHFCHWIWENRSISTITFSDFNEINGKIFKKNNNIMVARGSMQNKYAKFVNLFYSNVSMNNGIRQLVDSKSSRFSIDHVFQLFGCISDDVKTGFLRGMTKVGFIRMAKTARMAMIKDVAYFGYTHIKLTHCSKTLILGYDGKVYTTDGILVAETLNDIY